jgi:hypothetical protein
MNAQRVRVRRIAGGYGVCLNSRGRWVCAGDCGGGHWIAFSDHASEAEAIAEAVRCARAEAADRAELVSGASLAAAW